MRRRSLPVARAAKVATAVATATAVLAVKVATVAVNVATVATTVAVVAKPKANNTTKEDVRCGHPLFY